MSFQASYYVPPSTTGVRSVAPLQPLSVGQPQTGLQAAVRPFSAQNFQSLWTNGWFYAALIGTFWATRTLAPNRRGTVRGRKGKTTAGRKRNNSRRRKR